MTLSTPSAGHAPGLPALSLPSSLRARKPWDLTDCGPRKIAGLLTTPDRLTAWAEWFDLTAPPLRYTRGKPKTPDYLLYTDELLAWMVASHGSLDWFMEGDPRGMSVTFCRENARLAEFTDAVGRMDEQEQEWLLDVLKSGKTGDELQAALNDLTARVTAHRGAKVETDPLPALWAECQHNLEAWRGALDADGEETPASEALWTEYNRLGDTIRSTVASTREGLLAQLEYLEIEVVERGKGCAMTEQYAAPFLDVFRAGLERLVA